MKDKTDIRTKVYELMYGALRDTCYILLSAAILAILYTLFAG